MIVLMNSKRLESESDGSIVALVGKGLFGFSDKFDRYDVVLLRYRYHTGTGSYTKEGCRKPRSPSAMCNTWYLGSSIVAKSEERFNEIGSMTYSKVQVRISSRILLDTGCRRQRPQDVHLLQ